MRVPSQGLHLSIGALLCFTQTSAAEASTGSLQIEWLPIAGTLAGAALGWLLSLMQNLVTERRQARKALEAAALVCLEHLRVLQERLTNATATSQAVADLRESLVLYRTTVASAASERARHLPIHRHLVQVAEGPDPTNVERSITALEKVLGDRS